jgi:hypothetical protein
MRAVPPPVLGFTVLAVGQRHRFPLGLYRQTAILLLSALKLAG